MSVISFVLMPDFQFPHLLSLPRLFPGIFGVCVVEVVGFFFVLGMLMGQQSISNAGPSYIFRYFLLLPVGGRTETRL